MNVLMLYLLMVTAWCAVSGCGRSGGRPTYVSPPRDTTPPSITCPPDRTEYADPFQVNTKVFWDETVVVATDDRDGVLTWNRNGKEPGRLFSEGVTRIRYSAKDNSGNYKSCTFKITVIVKKCIKWGYIQDGWKICHVSHDASHVRRGSVCLFGCYGGHELVGPDKATCLDNGQWDIPTQPYCQKLQCPVLLPSPDQFDKVNIDCSDGYYYRSACSYSCLPGYIVLPGYSKVQLCNEFGYWLGSVPECVDTEPPTYITCPYGVTGYAEHTKTSGRVWWNTPQAEDNSGNVVTIQISGPSPGADLEVGEYDVAYMSYDAVNNTAICEFTVVVKQIKCHTIYPLPYTSVQCPTGRIYGSRCEFFCDENTALNGYNIAECQKQGSTVPYGVWTFENYQPYCELTSSCPALRPPDNGALACDTWLSGSFCQMLCEDKHLVMDDPSTEFNERDMHSRLLVCVDPGEWVIPGEIPNCQKATDRQWMLLKISLSYVYYTGDCTENLDDIKLKFIEAITKATGDSCDPATCNANAVNVICGIRTKRDTYSSRYIRETSDEGLTLEYSIDLPGDIDSGDALQLQTNVTNSLDAAIDNGDLDMEVNGTYISPTIEDSELQGGCSEGSVFDQQSLSCVECTAGYYYNYEYDSCSRCPVGYYQDEDRQTSCKICPTGTTTEGKGASSLQHCKDACAAGFYSNTGTEPCTVCDLGTYSTGYGSTNCTSCPGSQVTLKAAATSISECQDYDITYTVLNSTDPSVSALLSVENITSFDNVTIAFWVKCSQCYQILDIVDADGIQVVNIENTDQLRITWHEVVYETGLNITGSDTWKRITITTSDAVVTVYMDSMEVVSAAYTLQPLNTSINITIGGEDFVGSVSQFNIWLTPLTGPPISIDSCFDEVSGDIVAWREFYELDGTFTFTKSKCDAVDNCLDIPCENNGTCTDGIDSFSCACADGFTGSVCDVNIDDCEQSVCDNNGTCIDGVANYTCQCPEGFTGEFCEIKYVDGGWTDWVISGGCSVTCGVGVQNRSRVCENPEPSNGGKQCEGENVEFVECETNTTCVLDCLTDPPDIENGNINCSWTDESNDTRLCQPFCNEGFAFDSDMFVYTSGTICGPDTGYTWNINTTGNPMLQLPSCTAKTNAVTNILNYTMEYPTLNKITDDLAELIQTNADGILSLAGCVSTGKCSHQTMVYISSNATSVLLTVKLTCTVGNDTDECYNLLADIVQTLDDLISQQQFTVQYDGTDYHVGFNTTSLDGISTCPPGHIPVFNFCVPCGKGTYAYTTYCEVCPVGTYQDMEAQTSCKSCPIDWTTAGYMTRDRSTCNVYVDSTFTEQKITIGVIIGLAVGLTLGIVAIVVVGLRLLYKKPSKHAEIGSNVNLTNAAGMFNAKTKFHPTTLDANTCNDMLDVGDVDDDIVRPFTPAPVYDNYFGTNLEIEVLSRPPTAIQHIRVSPTNETN